MITAEAAIEPRYGGDGLVPVVVQDAADGRVLMVAYMDDEAVRATLATGDVHFHSRSRGRLWRKGETSGNVLHLGRLTLDCDGDAILALVRPNGPTCHRGTRSCFDTDAAGHADPPVDTDAAVHADPPVDTDAAVHADPPAPASGVEDFAWLENLWTTIEGRRRNRPSGSYTTSLLDAGVDAAGRKVTEEATEMLIAAKDDAAAESAGSDRGATSTAVAEETADLLYHLLVLLAERDVRPRAVIEVLQGRHSG